MKGFAIVYHKHRSSARTQFVKFSHGGVVGPDSLPELTCMAEERFESDQQTIDDLIAYVGDYFGIETTELCLNDEFNGAVETPNLLSPVYLISINTMDPPFDKAENKAAKFIALTEARGLPDFELLLLQKSYKAIMGG